MRLAKYIAHAGVASRRHAEEIIRAGRVSVDGQTTTDPARDVSDANRVTVDGDELKGAETRVVYALHKPRGVVSTARDPQGRPTVVELVPRDHRRLYPVGRLDADSTGLILLTNDGELAHRLTHPRYEVPRTYRARVGGLALAEPSLQRLRDGVKLEDGRTAPATVRRLGAHELEITLHEGRNRQVRRMCDAIGHPVKTLTRIRYGPLELGDLKPGDHRRLGARDVDRLRESVWKNRAP
jgi:23S rRNA pseudouridine2605 synthase